MPQIAQQDYKVIAPKEGRGFTGDAAAMGELKKAILNGIGFDCLLKSLMATESNTLNRVLGVYEDGTNIDVWDIGNGEVLSISFPYTITQYQGLVAVQNAVDEIVGLMSQIPFLEEDGHGHLFENGSSYYICVDGKYLIVTRRETPDGGLIIEALTIAETGPTENFINITWEDAQKLIGLPLA